MHLTLMVNQSYLYTNMPNSIFRIQHLPKIEVSRSFATAPILSRINYSVRLMATIGVPIKGFREYSKVLRTRKDRKRSK